MWLKEPLVHFLILGALVFAVYSVIGPDAPGVMMAAEVARFIQHYERLTRHMLAEMPARADLHVRLDKERKPVEIRASH